MSVEVNTMSPHRPSSPVLCCVIPCFNEEAVLPALEAQLVDFIRTQAFLVRVLFVDDGSRDRTFDYLEGACKRHPEFACLRLSRNFGHQAAVSAGLKNACGDIVAILDADLQDPLEVLPQMIAAWRQGYDVVYGVRQNRKEGFVLRACYALFYRMLKAISNIQLPLDAGDFSLMDRRVVDQLNAMPEHNRFVRGLRGWVGFRQTGVPYDRKKRIAGSTKYTVRRLFRLAFDGLFSFSSAPLKLATWMGVTAAGVGLILSVWAIISALFFDKTPPGWASLAVLIIFFSGVQLIVLGIIGEYIGRIFDEVKNRPNFIEDARVGWLAQESA